MLDIIRKHLGPRLLSQRANSSSVAAPALPASDWGIQTSQQLLRAPHRAEGLQQIKRLTSVPERHWLSLYVPLFTAYAELVQELPASEVHHHSHRGGMLDHTIEVVLNGLKLRRGYVLPVGAVPERISALAELYTYAVATSCLLHDIGKIASDQYIEVIERGTPRRWFPWEGFMRGDTYRMRFVRGRQYALHEPLALLLAQQIVPSAGLSWLASEPEVWGLWIEALNGSARGILSDIVSRADGASVARNLGANTGKAAALGGAPRPVQQKILTSLKHLLSTGTLALNRRGAAGWLTDTGLWLVSKTTADAIRAQLLAEGHDGIPSQNPRLFEIMQDHHLLIPFSAERAVWTCKVNDGQDWEHELTVLRLDPATLWTPDAMPNVWSGTIIPQRGDTHTESAAPVEQPNPSSAASIDAITNSLLNDFTPATSGPPAPTPQSVEAPSTMTPNAVTKAAPVIEKPTPEESQRVATEFVEWLKAGLKDGAIKINEADAPCHIVNNGLFLVTPGIFKRFVQANPHYNIAPSEPPRDQNELLEAVRSLKSMSNTTVGQESWQPIQRAFQKLKLHEKHALRGENIWRCTVQGARKRSEIKGFFLADPSPFVESGNVKNNKYLTLLES